MMVEDEGSCLGSKHESKVQLFSFSSGLFQVRLSVMLSYISLHLHRLKNICPYIQGTQVHSSFFE